MPYCYLLSLPNAKIQVQSSPHLFYVQHKYTDANEISYSLQKVLRKSFDARHMQDNNSRKG